MYASTFCKYGQFGDWISHKADDQDVYSTSKVLLFLAEEGLESKRFYNRIFIFINVPVNSTDPCSIEKGNLVE